jgi:ankyrin repeat protein
VQLLLDKGADPNFKNDKSWTPLSRAIVNGHETIVQLLLDKGADPDFKDDDGWTPLSFAIASGYGAIVQQLVGKGADLTVASANGWTPLFSAAQKGHDGLLNLLLGDNRIHPDSKDHYNSTLLSIAVRNGHEETVKLLLATECVALDSKDSFGRTPMWWSRRNGHSNIEKLLAEYAQKNGITISENDLPKEGGSRAYDESSRRCDVCALSLPRGDIYYKCRVCNSGNFDICLECFEIGAHCLDDSHKLVKRDDKVVEVWY